MGATINTGVGMGAYVLTDRATWSSFKNRGDYKVVVDKSTVPVGTGDEVEPGVGQPGGEVGAVGARHEDIELALELAERLDDTLTVAHITFQASLVADREGHWVLARTYAEKAKAQYEDLADRANVGHVLGAKEGNAPVIVSVAPTIENKCGRASQ